MTAAVPIVAADEATLRRIVGEELDSRLKALRDAIKDAIRPAPEDDEPLSRTDLAALLGIGLRTLRRMELAGVLPTPIRSSQRTVWWPRKTITAWMASGGQIPARRALSIKRARG